MRDRGGRARTGAARQCLPGAALPDAHRHPVRRIDAYELDVRALRLEALVALDDRTVRCDPNCFGVVDEADIVRVADVRHVTAVFGAVHGDADVAGLDGHGTHVDFGRHDLTIIGPGQRDRAPAAGSIDDQLLI